MANVYTCVFHGKQWGDNGSCTACDAEIAAVTNKVTNTPTYAGASYSAGSVGFGHWSTGWLDEHKDTESVSAPPALKCTEPVHSPAEILTSAIQQAEAMLPHGIEVTSDVSGRTAEARARCPHCDRVTGLTWLSWADRFPWTSAELAQSFVASARFTIPACISATCCDPLDRLVDGLRVRELLARYSAEFGRRTLTQAQRSAASAAWSSELKRKQAEARDRERMAVTVDDDRWDV